MLLQTSKQNIALQFIFLVLVTLLFGARHLVEPVALDSSFEMYSIFQGFSSLISTNLFLFSVIAVFLTFAQAWFLYFILQGNQLSRNPMFASVIYMLLLNSSVLFMGFHPFLVVNFLVMISYYYLLKAYDKDDSYLSFFTASFLWALATFFYFPLLRSFPLLLIILMVYRLYRWREWMVVLCGFSLPYIWFLGIAFVQGNLMQTLDMLEDCFFNFSVPFFKINLSFFILFFCLIIVIISIFQIERNKLELELPQRRKIKVFSLSFFYFLLLLFPLGDQIYSLLPCFIFGAFFISEWFMASKDYVWKESIFYFLFFMLLALHFVFG